MSKPECVPLLMALIGCLPNVPSVRGTNMNTEQPQYMEHACPCLHWTLSSFHGSIQSNTVNALSSVTLSVVSLLPLMVDKLFTNEMGQYLLMAMNNTLVKACSLCSTLPHIVPFCQHTSLSTVSTFFNISSACHTTGAAESREGPPGSANSLPLAVEAVTSQLHQLQHSIQSLLQQVSAYLACITQ